VARACWELALHQSPTLAIDTDCSKVELQDHKVPHHVTSVHAGQGQHVTLAAAAAVRLESTPVAVTGGDIMSSAVNNQPHTTVLSQVCSPC
jgi:hypothetical protein